MISNLMEQYVWDEGWNLEMIGHILELSLSVFFELGWKFECYNTIRKVFHAVVKFMID